MKELNLLRKLMGPLSIAMIILCPALLSMAYNSGLIGHSNSPFLIQPPLAFRPTATLIATPCPRGLCMDTLPPAQPIQKWPTPDFSP